MTTTTTTSPATAALCEILGCNAATLRTRAHKLGLTVDCPRCDRGFFAAGRWNDKTCWNCGGKGFIPDTSAAGLEKARALVASGALAAYIADVAARKAAEASRKSAEDAARAEETARREERNAAVRAALAAFDFERSILVMDIERARGVVDADALNNVASMLGSIDRRADDARTWARDRALGALDAVRELRRAWADFVVDASVDTERATLAAWKENARHFVEVTICT